LNSFTGNPTRFGNNDDLPMSYLQNDNNELDVTTQAFINASKYPHDLNGT
jgi:hypothetical protein